jgi:hypothetical protein
MSGCKNWSRETAIFLALIGFVMVDHLWLASGAEGNERLEMA